jgi:TPR repeat protein
VSGKRRDVDLVAARKVEATPVWGGGRMKSALALVLLVSLSGAFADDMDDRVQAALAQEASTSIVSALRGDAVRGNLKAAHELGLMYLEGRHVERDPAQARALFEAAEEQILYRNRYKLGYAESQFELGRMHELGIGGTRDPESAADWYERAAEQGHARSRIALARLYLDDSAPPRGFDSAYWWALLAVNSYGLSDVDRVEARRILDAARSRLAPPEIRLLERKAANWSPPLFAELD